MKMETHERWKIRRSTCSSELPSLSLRIFPRHFSALSSSTSSFILSRLIPTAVPPLLFQLKNTWKSILGLFLLRDWLRWLGDEDEISFSSLPLFQSPGKVNLTSFFTNPSSQYFLGVIIYKTFPSFHSFCLSFSFFWDLSFGLAYSSNYTIFSYFFVGLFFSAILYCCLLSFPSIF